VSDASPVLTSMLFVPASRPRMLEKARGLDAPAVIVDLEDGVGVGEKVSARENARLALAGGWPDRPLLFVRVNGVGTPYFEDDVAAIAQLPAYGVCLPKCETADDVRRAEQALGAAGARAGLRLLPFVESALGIVNAFPIASASPSVVAVALGSEDLAADMGIRRTAEGSELAYWRGVVSTAARAAGCQAIDGVYIDFGDPEGLERDAAAGRAVGFAGKQIIHPSQIEPVARAYRPSEAELERARRIVEAFEEAERTGAGVVVVDGRMIDRPIVLQALQTLGRR
jgi:citrate lyase subunit beta/citryl-CoA lyase